MKLLTLESPVAAPKKHLSTTLWTMEMLGESGNLFILSLDSPCPWKGEVCLPLWPELRLLQELAAAVEGAHVVDALAASPLPSEQADEGMEYKEEVAKTT